MVSLMEKDSPKASSTQGPSITIGMDSRNTPNGSGDVTHNRAGRASPSSDHGSMKIDSSGASYVGSSHWAAVLDQIADLKGHLEKEEETDTPQFAPDLLYSRPNSPQLLSGYTQHLPREEILASVPARPVADRLLSRFFNSFDVSPG